MAVTEKDIMGAVVSVAQATLQSKAFDFTPQNLIAFCKEMDLFFRETYFDISPRQMPAVPIKESIQGNYIICLEDGKKMKMLKRHLKVNFNLSPQQYREKWRLPSDYPMVAPNYSIRRSELAKDIGLGLDKKE
jgi:predicted transcriptional regulator